MQKLRLFSPSLSIGCRRALVAGNRIQSSALVSTCQSLGELCRPCDNTWPPTGTEMSGGAGGSMEACWCWTDSLSATTTVRSRRKTHVCLSAGLDRRRRESPQRGEGLHFDCKCLWHASPGAVTAASGGGRDLWPPTVRLTITYTAKVAEAAHGEAAGVFNAWIISSGILDYSFTVTHVELNKSSASLVTDIVTVVAAVFLISRVSGGDFVRFFAAVTAIAALTRVSSDVRYETPEQPLSALKCCSVGVTKD